MITAVYGYKLIGNAILVPGILGPETAVYLPLLSYSDIDVQTAKNMVGLYNDLPFQFRVLDPTCNSFDIDDTVTMRLDIEDKSLDFLFSKVILSKCRNLIRKSEKVGFEVAQGCDSKIISDFYEIFATTMHRHGTPVFSRKLFLTLPNFINSRYLVAYHEGNPIAAMCLVFDEKIAWVPWAGSLIEHRSLCPNYYLYWIAIKESVNAQMKVFDFGRSGYGSSTYLFKSQWGAQPVKITIVSSAIKNLYQKYSFASKIWKLMPRWFANFFGPFLCRHLPDL